ncbi:MAG: aminopeptidase P family protein [Syntrophobacterales bacterium]|jgi:Xaa-Pro aminopeptidase|nr:aminopeptidase P family protein [Syntrophobacterales bacterium]
MRDKRIGLVAQIIDEAGLDACILKGMDNIFYLTGFRGSEGSLLVTHEDVLLLTDFRYITHAMEVTKGIQVLEVQQKINSLPRLCDKYGIRKMGFDSAHTTYDMYARWTETLGNVELVPLNKIETIRAIKDPEEIETIKKAIRISTDAFTEVYERIKPGRTEKEIANELEYTMKRLGADCPSFNTIVASGPRAALPHAEPTDRELKDGEAVIIDFGAQVDSYCSDETCTITLGKVNGKIDKIYSIVREAKDLGLDSIRAGMPAKELDMIVRGFIDRKGYGDFFRHGVGHGVGVAVHEAPAVNYMSESLIEPNMVLTIEPGIYIPHLGGVRLEDMVLIEENRTTVLTHIRKDMLSVRS